VAREVAAIVDLKVVRKLPMTINSGTNIPVADSNRPSEIEFAPWHKQPLCVDQGNNKEQFHGYTDGSCRFAAAFGWTLLRSNMNIVPNVASLN
jgi:hypothetical protein